MNKWGKQFKKQFQMLVIAIARDIENAVQNGEVAEYFEDVLDIEITFDLQGGYRGVCIELVGGANRIEYNTRDFGVKGYWGGDCVFEHVNEPTTKAVDDFYKEFWKATVC